MLAEGLHSKEEVVSCLQKGIQTGFNFSGVSVYLFDTVSYYIDFVRPEKEAWPLPERERTWLIHRTKDLLIGTSVDQAWFHYVADRTQFLYADKDQLKADVLHFKYPCWDMLYLMLISEEEVILGVVQINNWLRQKPLPSGSQLTEILGQMKPLIDQAVQALDNFLIHQKIESLLSDKKVLKQRIQKDEEDLRRRILELSVLYETSNALSYSLDYSQILKLIMDALYRVLGYDVCAIFLLGFEPNGEVILRANRPVSEELIQSVQGNVITAVSPFIKAYINPEKVHYRREPGIAAGTAELAPDKMKSFANVPLIFKEEVIGMLNVCSATRDAFSRSEMTFLHTLANQLSSHLGRLKAVKNLEKSKIAALIQSMSEGVLMLDEKHQLEILNPAAVSLLGMTQADFQLSVLAQRFTDMGLIDVYHKALQTDAYISTPEITYLNYVISINIAPVRDADQNRIGTVFVFRDLTEIHKSNRIKTQRLEAISKLNLVLNSIADLNNLLTILMEYILNVAHADTGSIQLLIGRQFMTQVHSNFPDKVRRSYRFLSGETISEYAIRTKTLYSIPDYANDPHVDKDYKLLIDSYICAPIIVKGELIGIVNIVRKKGFSTQVITEDDLNTINTITAVSGNAIQNALLYQKNLEKQRLDQELKVATTIQMRLLPESVPLIDRVDVGVLSSPAREIGGDYYDFFKLPDGRIGIVIADIVGKGIPAGLFMAMLKSILHMHIPMYITPKETMERLNVLLYQDPVINKFVPLFYAVLDTKTLALTYCNAGHEPAIIFSNNRFVYLKACGLPLGAVEAVVYEERSVNLMDGDLVMLYTDGLIDARNKQGDKFGFENVESAIQKLKPQRAQSIVETLFTVVEDFESGQSQQDDITLVALKVDFAFLPSQDSDQPTQIKKYRITSAKKHIKKIRQEVGTITTAMGFQEADIFNLKLAVNEAHANVIEHAYHGSENGEILFHFYIYKDRLEILIKDFGDGIGRTIKNEKHLDELEGSGLGVYLIKSMVDHVEYKRTSRIGTELWLTKYINKEKGGDNGDSQKVS